MGGFWVCYVMSCFVVLGWCGWFGFVLSGLLVGWRVGFPGGVCGFACCLGVCCGSGVLLFGFVFGYGSCLGMVCNF